jgi:hypothetical protein
MAGRNLTGLKTFDRLARDPRVVEVRSEGADGYWVDLAPGYRFKDCISVHEYTVRDVLSAMSRVERERAK